MKIGLSGSACYGVGECSFPCNLIVSNLSLTAESRINNHAGAHAFVGIAFELWDVGGGNANQGGRIGWFGMYIMMKNMLFYQPELSNLKF